MISSIIPVACLFFVLFYFLNLVSRIPATEAVRNAGVVFEGPGHQ
jgi:hypothetical protein